MDPLSALGAISGALQVAQIIGQTIAGLSSLRGKYQHADLTIRSMIGELSTIKSAITQLYDWTKYNVEVNSSHREYEDSLAVAIDSCSAIMEVIRDKVAELTAASATGQANMPTLTFKARIQLLWNEDLMRNLEERLHSQVRALNLLLQACQCRSSTEQLELLRKVESRHIIQKVADDTVTLRSTISSVASSQVDSLSINSRRLSSVGDTEFEFDSTLMATLPYQRPRVQSQVVQMQPILPQVEANIDFELRRGVSISTSNSASDEGYASNNVTPSQSLSPNTSLHRGQSLGPNDLIMLNHGRSKSVSFGTQQTQQNPDVRRWVSTSDATTLPSTIGSKREKFLSKLKRLNTSSRATLSPSLRNATINPIVGSTRARRGRESGFTTSIDLNTQTGRSAPDIVKAAQSGARYDVERLLGNGHDIEEIHLHTRRNALMVAAHCGKDDIAALLVQNNAQLNRSDASGSTALHLAASRGHVSVVELLVMEAIDIEAETRLGRTALWVSANNGHWHTTHTLLESRAKVNARADNQMTALHVAARQGDVEISRLLVSYGADIDARDASMMTALHYACEGGYVDVVELLLNNKADIDGAGSERKTPLICAAANGKLMVVQMLLRRKSKFRAVDEGGMTALHWAAYNGHVDIVDYLASQSRSFLVLTNRQGRTPLHLAAMNSQFAVVELLARKNCVLYARCAAGLNALHYACKADSIEIVRLLLTYGVDIESEIAVTQQRPIHISAGEGSVGLVRLLCEKGASLEARDAEGDRALCVATRHGHVAAVQTLLDFGSPLYLRSGVRSCDSPLCLAAKGGHLPVVALLIRSGAPVLSKDELGWTPFRYAACYGHPEILEAILAAEPSAMSPLESTNFSPDTVGMASGRLEFAPDANISADRKRRVTEILSRSRQPWTDGMLRSPAGNAITPAPRVESDYDHYTVSTPTRPANAHRRTLSMTPNIPAPSELPGTLEQGLPSSRSATPPHMHRGEQEATATLSAVSNQPRVFTQDTPSQGYQFHTFNPSTILPADRLAQSLAQLNFQLDEAETTSSHAEVEDEEETHEEEIPEIAELEGTLPPPYHAYSSPML
ncbi:ankyrin repeat protein [Talaromyces stipitatus ATCC 10500]|uniref:protein S-acyltransferase n=1 Tax=Talaromyces stipitatus (strain ATCC 10500 / CBS 375.48 / QM 6759 / NRRL 1006) TaxID=441959 RepID=B8MH16_TALSN|nr:ankyrin repeat protein [Talaromyces stipitatus ATCC 10500]EED16830.1 ankyrin repeat protein [Talaromyces stipitatus ATCC 10500]